MSFKSNIVKIPFLGRVFLITYRFKNAFPYVAKPLSTMIKWLFTSKETTNFTYDLTHRNKKYLASTISVVTKTPTDIIERYISELNNDSELKNHIISSIIKSNEKHKADLKIYFGRRLGWYAFVRATKPKIVIETGVDKGLGSCVLSAALIKNTEEGFPGKYYGTDINQKAGYLLSGKYAEVGKILYGDSIESLKELNGKVDLFINDSDHSADYEAEEYKTIKDKLSSNAILLGDNSHCTDKLFEFSNLNNMKFIFFKEEPSNHWSIGAGIGIAWK